jgi:hypothetical protein
MFFPRLLSTRDEETLKKKIQYLRRHEWIDNQTKELKITGVLFNAQARKYSSLVIPIEFEKSGEEGR